MANRQFVLPQVVSLCKIYQKLENNNLFIDSPQNVHLSHTISGLFEVIPADDKMKIYNMFNIREDKNMKLWSCLKVRNLPNETQYNAEEIAMEHFKTQIQKLTFNDDIQIDIVIKSIQLASTCTLMNRDDEAETMLISAWTIACPTNMKYTVKVLSKGNLWYYRYIEALVALTESMEHVFHGNSCNLIKVLHTVHSIVHSSCKELKLLLINILCKLANFETHDVNKHVADSILTQTFSELLDSTDTTVKNKLLFTLRECKSNNLFKIVSNVVNNKNECWNAAWNHFAIHGSLKKSCDTDLKEKLQCAVDFEYCHKCVEDTNDVMDSGTLNLQKSLSSNFDLIDIDTLFDPEPEQDAEPACKKAKLNTNEAEEIITRLESDASLLSKIKENVFTSEYKSRIKTICNKLSNIID